MKTFGRATYLEARKAWLDGAFGSEWTPIRLAAAERGFIFPPYGSAFDQVDDPWPSQRAIIHRAIEETPSQLELAIASSRSWQEVVGILLAWWDQREAQVVAEERSEAERRAATDWTRDEAELTLGEIRRRIGAAS